MTTSLLPLENLWESMKLFEICEDSSEVDGVHILARVKGPAFFPETTSGNGVFYPIEAWEAALAEPTFQRRLKDRLIFGTIGHDQVIDDDAIKKGLFSHLVIDMYIDEDGEGMAEYLVLNTPTGQILNTVLRARSKLRVSTKCKGLFQGASKTVNPEMFFIERVDFVLDPGYLQALPGLMESLQTQSATTLPIQENDNMSTTEAANLDPAVTKLISILESQIDTLKDGTEEKQGLVDDLNVKLGEVTGVLTTLQQANADLQTQCDELTQQLDTANTGAAAYEDLGTPEEIAEALKKSEELIGSLNTRLQDTLPSVQESLRLQPIEEELKAYQAYGSLGDLKALATQSEMLADKFIKQKVKGIAKKFGCIEESVQKLADKGMSFKEIEESITGLKGPAKTSGKPSSRTFQQSSVKDINESSNRQEGKPTLTTKLFGRR